MDFLTESKLKRIVPRARNIEEWHDVLHKHLPPAGIDTIKRVSMFLAQTSHESAGFTLLSENLNYSWQSLRKVFRKYFPNDDIAKEFHRKPELIASRVYGGRMGNGEQMTGDGWLYRGRGLIQITGKNNYSSLAEFLEMSLPETIDYLETIEGAAHSAVWYWDVNSLNKVADKGDMVRSTKIINGGDIGLKERIEEFERILNILRG